MVEVDVREQDAFDIKVSKPGCPIMCRVWGRGLSVSSPGCFQPDVSDRMRQ